MLKIFKGIRGDKALWLIVVLLALISVFPIYSSSSNIAFMYRNGNTLSMLLSHCIHLSLGLGLMYFTHKMDYRHFGALSKVLLPVLVVLLAYTLFQGVNVSNASRWIKIPFTNKTFQTSALAWVILPIYIARYIAINPKQNLKSFQRSFLPLIAPVLTVCALVLPANFSTAALLFSSCLILLFVGGYPLKNIFILLASGLVTLSIFILVIMAFPNINSRVDTWKTRIESFASGDADSNYQVHKAKMAIAEGQLIGKGPGKSIQKNFLPQSNSDFIYAVFVEEFGLLGGLGLLFIYSILFVRILIISTKASSNFGSLVAFGVGIGIMLQTFVNLGVAVNIFPVTGQTLPLVSAGGSSIWMTCVAIGVILSVSAGKKAENTKIQEAEEEAVVKTLNNPLNA